VALGTKGMALAYQKKLDSTPLLNYLAAGMCSAPTLGGKNIYQMDNQGVTFVIEPGPEFKQLARNRIETYLERDFPIDPLETTYSNPVFDGKSLYIRSEKFLYRIESGK
jgi:hypothetical protein